MNLEFGEKHTRFRGEVRAFIEAERERMPRRGALESHRPNPEQIGWQRTLIDRGYASRSIPKEYGGFGGEADVLKNAILSEEFSRGKVPHGFGGSGASMLAPTLLEHGSEAQRRRYIPPALTGEEVWCQGYSEPGSGSDLASLRTAAVPDGPDFVINGQKIWTSGAHLADMMFALVRTEPEARKHEGISYLLVPMTTPGIEVRPLQTMTGEALFNEVFFTDVRVPQANLVGERGAGWRIGNTTLRHERNMLGSASYTENLLQRLRQLMQSECLDGVRAIDRPVLRDRFVRLQARAWTMKYHSMRLLTDSLCGRASGAAGLVVKLQGCELNHDIAALAIDAMGEFGPLYHGAKYERSHGAWQREYMLSLGLIIGGGTAQIQKNIIAERGLGMPREPKAAGG